MEQRIELTPEELIAQSEQMANLRTKYDNLFSGVSTVLNDLNGNWSENLAHNFSGKIMTAQKSFEKISELLQVGSDAARKHADGFQSLDVTLSKFDMSGFMGHVANGAAGLHVSSSGEVYKGAGRSFRKVDVANILAPNVYSVIKAKMDSDPKFRAFIEDITVDIFEPVADSKFFKRTNEISNRISQAAKDGDYIEAAGTAVVGVFETVTNASVDLVLDKGLGAVNKVLKELGADKVLEQLGFEEANETIKEYYGVDVAQCFEEFPETFRDTMTEYSQKAMDVISDVNDVVEKGVKGAIKYIKNLMD